MTKESSPQQDNNGINGTATCDSPRVRNTNPSEDQCALCHQDFPKLGSAHDRTLISCCGSQICSSCRDQWDRQDGTTTATSLVLSGSDVPFYFSKTADKACAVCCATTPTIPEEAYELNLHHAKTTNAAWAEYALACNYYNGSGCPKSTKKALEWFQKAAHQGHPGAQSQLGLMYLEGENQGGKKSAKKALPWLQKAAASDYAPGILNLAELYAEQGRISQAVALWQRLATEGNHPVAQCRFADALFQQRRLTKATQWYLESALQDYAPAQHQLIGCYLQARPQPAALMLYWMQFMVQHHGDQQMAQRIHGLNAQLQAACAKCRKAAEQLQACSQCKSYFYCSKECQVQHWKEGGHKVECNQVKALKARGPDLRKIVGLEED